jgi:hypothetical protein
MEHTDFVYFEKEARYINERMKDLNLLILQHRRYLLKKLETCKDEKAIDKLVEILAITDKLEFP